MEPLNKRILVKEVVEEKTESGIILTSPDKDKQYKRGLVIEQDKDVPYPLKGKTVVFNKFTPVEYTSKGDKYLIVKFEDLYGIE